MRIRLSTILATVSASMLLAAAGHAAAETSHDWTGWQAGLSVGQTEGQRHGAFADDLSPSGTVVTLSVEDRFMLGDFVAGVELGGRYGNTSDSESGISCTVAMCGYDETYTRGTGSDYGLTAGVSLGHPVGPTLVSVRLGVEAANGYDTYHYDSKGAYPTWNEKVEGYRLGAYYGVRVEYPLSDTWGLRADWTRSDLSERSDTWTGGSSDVSYQADTVTLGVTRSF